MAEELNYYDPKDAYVHMHASNFKNFLFNGEAEALANMAGTYDIFENKTALLVGNFLHSYFESKEAHQEFKDNHPEIISQRGKSKGELKSEFKVAQKMIKRIKLDPVIMALVNGAPDKEYVIDGDINGVAWRGKLDAVNLEERYFIDFKTVKSLKEFHSLVGGEWSDYYNEYTNFFVSRGYHIQMAAYQEMLKQMTGQDFEVYVVAVSKEDEPLADIYKIDQDTLDSGMREILANQDHIVKLINGEVQPVQAKTYSRLYRSTYRVDPEHVGVL
ncbi:PD-(D/E)XK nuclease-like domain-containing protein [Weissella sagaensis]|uniref:PD-(D/E)XK nuclease-like domain-containing protein n=1 Tax=Weissella sagaensis TaxID=2559928 RepID=UPI0013ED3420|nr:PD-(D/E)XK nuclease-like domain-containing protein [Weissella sagaensis]